MADPVEVPKSVWELIVEAAPASEHPEVCKSCAHMCLRAPQPRSMLATWLSELCHHNGRPRSVPTHQPSPSAAPHRPLVTLCFARVCYLYGQMRRAIGERLIDKAETLHTEVISLLDIWRDYRSTIEAEQAAFEEQKQAKKRMMALLPEPPMVRESLKREISFFVETLRSKGAEIQKVGHAAEIIDYALDKEVVDNPHSSVETPLRPTSSLREGAPPKPHEFEEELSAVVPTLSVFTLDAVVGCIRKVTI